MTEFKKGQEVWVKAIVNSEVRNGGIHVLQNGCLDSFHYLENIRTDIPEKPVVPQVAVEFYENYKDDGLSFAEWFGDFYSKQAIEDFPRLDELCVWLYDNKEEVNQQRELALATLIVNGIDAVEVEQEKLYTVEIPNPNETDLIVVLRKWEGCVSIDRCGGSYDWKKDSRFHLTEAEIRKDFEWAWQFAEPVEEVE